MVKPFLLLAFLVFCHTVAGQSQATDSIRIPVPPPTPARYCLVLDKPGKVNRLKFYEGSSISFTLTGEKRKYSGRISKVNKRSIVFWDAEIPIRDISKVRIEKQTSTSNSLRFISSGLRGIGGLFMLVGGGNFILNTDRRNDKKTFLGAAGLYAVGQAFRGFNKRTYKINKNRVLKTMQLSPVTPPLQ